jgi:hypothetical protein
MCLNRRNSKRRGCECCCGIPHMKSETDLKFELAGAISISTAKPKSGQANKIFS